MAARGPKRIDTVPTKSGNNTHEMGAGGSGEFKSKKDLAKEQTKEEFDIFDELSEEDVSSILFADTISQIVILKNEDEVWQNIDMLVNDRFVEKLMSNVDENGNFNYQTFVETPDGKYSNTFISSLIANERFGNNAATILSEADWDKFTSGAKFGPKWHGLTKGKIITQRGVTSRSIDGLNFIINSYTDPLNPCKYSNGSACECYGKAIYTSMDGGRTASSYSSGGWSNRGTVINISVDLNKAHIMWYTTLKTISDMFNTKYNDNRYGQPQSKLNQFINQKVKGMGGDDKLSSQIASSVCQTLKDPGMMAVLLGIDGYYVETRRDHRRQFEIVNCGIMKIKEPNL